MSTLSPTLMPLESYKRSTSQTIRKHKTTFSLWKLHITSIVLANFSFEKGKSKTSYRRLGKRKKLQVRCWYWFDEPRHKSRGKCYCCHSHHESSNDDYISVFNVHVIAQTAHEPNGINFVHVNCLNTIHK